MDLRRFRPLPLVILGLLAAACAGGAGGGASLTGTVWILSSLDGEAPMTGTTITAELEPRGNLGGTSGCNSYSAQYQVSDSSMTIGPTSGTLMACAEAVMAQETAFLAALGATTSYAISGDQLALEDSSGDTRLVFEAQSRALSGSSWTVLSYNTGKRAVASTINGTKITADFGEDRQLTGNAGCNEYFASYQISADSITIGAPSATRMFCSEPEGVMDQEAQYLAALQTAATYSLEGNSLEFRTADGALAVTFQQAAP
jgi:heat shock protein HslJ